MSPEITGFVLGLGGALLLYALSRFIWPVRAKQICGCGHSRGYHQDGAGACHQKNVDMRFKNAFIDCNCQLYDGPPPPTSSVRGTS